MIQRVGTDSAAERVAWRLDTPLGLAALFALGLAIRLAIAPYIGYYDDLAEFQQWATRLDAVGTHAFYTHAHIQWESPGYLYVLWVLGKISTVPSYLLLKLPAIFADLGLAWAAATFAVRLAPDSLKARAPVRPLVAAAVLFNPAVFAVSAVWGQIDSIPTLFLLSGMLLLFTGPRTLRWEIAAFLLFALSVAVKPQAVFVLPVLLYALYRRHLRRRRGRQLAAGALSIGAIGAASLGLWAVSGLAFGLDPVELFRFNRSWAALYPYTSVNAFNLWGVFGLLWRHDSSGDQVVRVAGITAYHAGWLLFLLGVAVVLWRVDRALARGADEARVYSAATFALGVVAFVVLTRMHERYLFFSLLCLAPLVFVRRLRYGYVALSALYFLNLWYAFSYYGSAQEHRIQRYNVETVYRWLFRGHGVPAPVRAWSLAVTVVALAVAYLALRWGERPAAASGTTSANAPSAPIHEQHARREDRTDVRSSGVKNPAGAAAAKRRPRRLRPPTRS
jgi:dolichyl-phosphate-mannose-protein mannosyltransferase